jgi:hypothetical protein
MSKPQQPAPKERGTTDEVEILRDIIKRDPYLMEKVLNRIRHLRQTSATGLIDQMAKKQVDQLEEQRNKRGRPR